MTFDTAGQALRRPHFRPMETISLVIWSAAATCLVALIGILWKYAERADEVS